MSPQNLWGLVVLGVDLKFSGQVLIQTDLLAISAGTQGTFRQRRQ